MKIVLLTSGRDEWIGCLVRRLKELQGVTFEQVILWQGRKPLAHRIRKNIRKHGLVYLPWRLLRAVRALIGPRLERFLFAPKREEDLFSVCAELNIAVSGTADLHAAEGLQLLKASACDLLVVCGAGIIKKAVLEIPKLGVVNLHQGEVPRYRGAPPGFWELWNGEPRAGVTVHFVDEGIDTGDIVMQRTVPICADDDPASLQRKLAEVSLSLYPEAIGRIAAGNCPRARQPQGVGKQYSFPSLKQMFLLSFRLRAKRFNLLRSLRTAAKKSLFALSLPVIALRDRAWLLRGRDVLSVLYYHRVTDLCRDGMTVGTEDFEKQVRFLKKNYRILSAAELEDWLDRGPRGKGEKAVLITFDDGYEDNYSNAHRILKKYGCPAVFFIATGYIGNGRRFAHDAVLQPELRFRNMTWQQVLAISGDSSAIGVHSHDHCDLGAVPHAEAVRQIEASLDLYRQHLGERKPFMSFPFGGKQNVTTRVIDHLRRQGAIAALFSAYGNKNVSPLDRYNINRINIGSNDGDLLIFWYKAEGELRSLFRPGEKI